MKILYLISGRSAATSTIGRKITAVTESFNKIVKTDLLCAGDIVNGQYVPEIKLPLSNIAAYHNKWYRKNTFMNFFTRSYSELRDLIHCYHTWKLLKKRAVHYDLIWERSSRLHWAGLLYAKKHNVKRVLEWKDHLVDYRWSLFHRLAIYMETWKNHNADFITVESEVLRQNLIQSGIQPHKIFVTYNAVNPDEFVKSPEHRQEVRNRLNIKPDDWVIGYCGSYAFYHDSLRMILAAEILKDKGINSVKWLLVGSGRDYGLCRKAAEEKDLLNKTVFMIPRVPKEEVPKYLSAFDLAILPGSTDIICPIKVMEYMAAETTVLLPDYPCNREVVTEENGILFQPFSEQSIADSILKLLKTPEQLLNLSHNARKRVKESFTWDKTYGAVLKQILDSIAENENSN